MNRFKFNSGNGALVCNKCNRILVSPISPKKANKRLEEECHYCKNKNPNGINVVK